MELVEFGVNIEVCISVFLEQAEIITRHQGHEDTNNTLESSHSHKRHVL